MNLLQKPGTYMINKKISYKDINQARLIYLNWNDSPFQNEMQSHYYHSAAEITGI